MLCSALGPVDQFQLAVEMLDQPRAALDPVAGIGITDAIIVMQRSGMEWAYRLMQAPTRMASRYLVRGPRVFSLLLKARIVLRKTAAPIPVPSSSPIPAPAPMRVPQSVIVRG